MCKEPIRNFQFEGENGDDEEVLNLKFSKAELNSALRKLGKTSPGKDGICYSMLNNLTNKGKDIILCLYNKIWEMGAIPNDWKKAVIIPIKKPGKNPEQPSNYRPIALTSHMGKTMERMINDRLTFWIETKGKLENYQSGFRKGRWTMDPIIRLEDDIRKAQVNRESVVAVFLDIEKAYDMLWKDGLLIKLNQMGIRGHMFQWIKQFLSERTIAVKINGIVSDSYRVENGIPQGSIISPLLFSIMIN